MRSLVLASSSPYRRALLERLQLPFCCASPDIDESPRLNESPEQLVARLAHDKATALATAYPDSLIIGSDQVAVIANTPVSKPGNREAAIAQLTRASGQRITFLTGLCVYDAISKQHWVVVEPFHVHFKTLTAEQIAHYVDREQPFDCAGSFKCEGLGIALFEKLEGDDPNSLIGLPLIRLVALLEQAGLPVL